MLQILLALLFLFLGYHFYWKRRNLPPGPLPFPIIGNLRTILKNEPGYEAFIQWKKQYGPVYTYWLGSIPVVGICDYPTLKETFIRDGEGYMDKYNNEEMTYLYRGGFYGVIDTNGDFWKEHRRFALLQLKEMGLGQNLMEQRVLHEVECLTKTLRNQINEDVNITAVMDVAVGSVINQLLFGYRFDEDKIDDFLFLKHLMSDQMKTVAHPVALLLVMFPKMKCLPHFDKIMHKIMGYRDSFHSFFENQISEHEKHIDYDSTITTDYVNSYLKEKRRLEKEGDYETYNMIQLKNMCFDLWIAGMETTSNTMSWQAVYILNHPGVQDKVHAELDSVIGSSRTITMADKNNLIYIQAVINETQRLANLLPQNLLHMTTRDVCINGLNVPKGTPIAPQISVVLYDETVFPEPYAFKPERFLDENGKLRKIEEFIPFSIGKRQCLGEGIAKMELFLFTANFYNRFRILPVGEEPPSMKKHFGTTVQPSKFRIRMEER